MPTNFINETIEDTEMEKFIRGPHPGQGIFAGQSEEFKAWYRDFIDRNPHLVRPKN
jgi:hypothetical protein